MQNRQEDAKSSIQNYHHRAQVRTVAVATFLRAWNDDMQTKNCHHWQLFEIKNCKLAPTYSSYRSCIPCRYFVSTLVSQNIRQDFETVSQTVWHKIHKPVPRNHKIFFKTCSLGAIVPANIIV